MPFPRKPAFTGFPFDDTDYEPAERTRPFRSHLDGIAQRHPEFTEYFQGFPFRTNSLGRKRCGSGSTGEDDARSQASSSSNEDRGHGRPSPFPSRFDAFFSGQPGFRDRFEEEEDPRFGFARQQAQAQQPPQQETQKKPPRDDSNRGRKQNPNLPQSNTVDLGQKQAPVDENRSQRSMSAPPDNRSSPRYVSSLHIPMNQQQQPAPGEMGSNLSYGSKNAAASGAQPQNPQYQPQPHHHQQQPQQHHQQQQQPTRRPTERVIPIHVEGRDEPVLPKNANTPQQQQYQQPQQHFEYDPQQQQQQQHQPPPQKVFGQDPGMFTQFMQRNQQQQQQPQQEDANSFRNQQQQYQRHQQQQYQDQKEAAAPPPPAPKPLGPIEQIQLIQKDVSELMRQAEGFNGTRTDKQYIYLDEMLTRNLLKLDNIETEGKENIRSARKEAIKCIQSSISHLEKKAKENSAEAAMETEVAAADSSEAEVAGASSDVSSSSDAKTAAVVGESAMEGVQEAVPDSSAHAQEAEADSQMQDGACSSQQQEENATSSSGTGSTTATSSSSLTTAEADGK